jgi:hypothetical protein
MWAGGLVEVLAAPSTSKFRHTAGFWTATALGRTKFPTTVEFSLQVEASRSRKDIPLVAFAAVD